MHGTGGAADDVVARKTPKGSSPTSARGHQDGVAEAERLALAHVGDLGQLRDGLIWPGPRLAALFQVVLELEGGVEVVLDRALAAAGHDDDLVQPGGDRTPRPRTGWPACRRAAASPWLGLGGGSGTACRGRPREDGFAYVHRKMLLSGGAER
jgi:hypothetical protein